jgi:hypothetical protein
MTVLETLRITLKYQAFFMIVLHSKIYQSSAQPMKTYLPLVPEVPWDKLKRITT